MDIEKHIKDKIDYVEPKCDIYEFAIYMYLIRNTRVENKSEDTFGFKSLRKTIVIGVGEAGKPMSEQTCYGRLKKLELKGLIKIKSSNYNCQVIEVKFPSENFIKLNHEEEIKVDVEDLDFFNNQDLRTKILERDNWKCFYCFKALNSENYVLEHVVSRPTGNNSYRNLVASCRTCNNKKDKLNANDFLRKLYRDNLISDEELKVVAENLENLVNGLLKPKL